jgi:hypothetical protein
VRPLASDHGQGLHVGYRGTRGCRVSLIVLPAVAALPQKPVMLAGAGRQHYVWRVGGLGYALLASGMDPKHYQVVLHTVHEASLKQAPVGPETRVALAESRARSRPCLLFHRCFSPAGNKAGVIRVLSSKRRTPTRHVIAE